MKLQHEKLGESEKYDESLVEDFRSFKVRMQPGRIILRYNYLGCRLDDKKKSFEAIETGFSRRFSARQRQIQVGDLALFFCKRKGRDRGRPNILTIMRGSSVFGRTVVSKASRNLRNLTVMSSRHLSVCLWGLAE
jgi:hypothetical protein